MRTVADIFNVSVGFVHHTVDLHGKYGQITGPYAQLRRGHQTLTPADEDCIRGTLIEARPSVCLDKIQDNFHTNKSYIYVQLLLQGFDNKYRPLS